MVRRLSLYVIMFFLTLGAMAGCGYTRKSLLSESIKNIFVAPVKNSIDLAGEVSSSTPFRVYRPGTEVDLTNAFINRFIFDGNLKITSAQKADALLEARLIDYRRDAVRYTSADDIQEYRLSITVEVMVTEIKTQKILWKENVVGDTSYFLSGPLSKTEDQAAADAVDDVARRVVDKTIEIW